MPPRALYAARATLVVAKLDRLTRSVAVTSMLHTAGVDFVCCDNPNADRLTIQILAAVAEDEARRISERTKAVPSRTRRDVLGLRTMEPLLTFDFEDGKLFPSFAAADRDMIVLNVESRYHCFDREGLRVGENVRFEWADDDADRLDMVITKDDGTETSVVGRIRAS